MKYAVWIGLLLSAAVAWAAPTYRLECNCPYKPGTNAVICYVKQRMTYAAGQCPSIDAECECYYDQNPPMDGCTYACGNYYSSVSGAFDEHYGCQTIFTYEKWPKCESVCVPDGYDPY